MVLFSFSNQIPGGNGILISHQIKDLGDEIVFRAETKFNEPRPCWFCFRVTGLKKGTARFIVANAAQFLSDTDVSGWVNNHPVYRKDGKDWERADHCVVSYDEVGTPLVYFDVITSEDSMDVAFCYPYQQKDLDEVLVDLPYLQQKVIGFSTKGRPIYRYRTISDNEEKPSIYLTGRIHGGEVGGSYVLEGFLKYFSTPEGQRLLKYVSFWIVPIVDVDAVEEGAYGKDQAIGDMNRSFKRKNALRGEIDALVQDMERWRKHSIPQLVMDFHSPAHEVLGVLMNFTRPIQPEIEEAQLRLLNLVNQELEKKEMELAEANYPGMRTELVDSPQTMESAFVQREYHLPSPTWEISYQGGQNGTVFTKETYYEYGACIAQAAARYLMEYRDSDPGSSD